VIHHQLYVYIGDISTCVMYQLGTLLASYYASAVQVVYMCVRQHVNERAGLRRDVFASLL
jgi:hypothetical protein